MNDLLDPAWATYKYSDVNYPMEYWEEGEATP